VHARAFASRARVGARRRASRRRARDAAEGLCPEIRVVNGRTVRLERYSSVFARAATTTTRDTARRRARIAMPITPGVHEPHVAYVPPASEHAWGAKGDWAGKSARDCYLEEQYEKTRTTEGYDGRIDHARLRNHEVRLRDEDSKFVPNAKNVAPRAKDWKAGAHANAY
jgi:hypothetical protein